MEINIAKGIRTVLKERKTRFSKILISIFPEMNLDPAKFSILPGNFSHLFFYINLSM